MSAKFNLKNLFSPSASQTARTSHPSSTSPVEENEDELMWELLSLYADGEASPEEAAQVEAMLRHDAEYARAYSGMRQAGSAIRTIVEVDPPAHLRDAILSATSHRPTLAKRLVTASSVLRGQFHPPVLRLAFAGGSLAAAALLLGLYTARMGTDNGNVTGVTSGSIASATSGQRQSITSPAEAGEALPNYQVPDPLLVAPPRDTAPVAVGNAPAGALASPPAEKATAANTDTGTSNKALNALGKTKLEILPSSVGAGALSPSLGSKMPKLATAAYVAGGAKDIASSKHAGQAINSGVQASGSYNAQGSQGIIPRMDDNDKHMILAKMDTSMSDQDDLGQDVQAGVDDSSVSDGSGDSDAGTNSVPQGKRKISGALQISKLPPMSRHILSSADIKRVLDANTLGYSRATLEGIQRREADLPVLNVKY